MMAIHTDNTITAAGNHPVGRNCKAREIPELISASSHAVGVVTSGTGNPLIIRTTDKIGLRAVGQAVAGIIQVDKALGGMATAAGIPCIT